MRFKNFEIRPTCFLDGHTDPKRWDVVKWYDHDPIEVTEWETGKKKFSTRSCYSVASLTWDEKERCWELESVGMRFLRDYEEGLCELILKWTELASLVKEFEDGNL